MAPEDTGAMSNLNRRQLVAGLGAAGAAGLAGCTGGDGGGSPTATEGDGDEETPTPTQDTATPAETYKIGGELIASIGADLKNTDPTQINDTTSSKMSGLVYEGVMTVDFAGKPQPVLAKEVTVEGTSSTISLREGIQFHNGSELTAEDVIASFERYKGTPREADVGDWYKWGSATAEDQYTVSLELSRKYAPYKFSVGVPIVPKEVTEGEIDLSKAPVGTGPFVFEKHEPDSFVRFTRNQNYWGPDGIDVAEGFPPKPPIETATFRVITEQSAQLAALKAGDIDLANGPPAGSISDLKKNSKFKVTERVAGGFDMFIYPMHPKAGTPFQNRKVRQGVNRLIPRQAIVDTVYNGIGRPAYAPISPLAAAFTSKEFQQQMADKYARYNVSQAKQLLSQGFEEAGFDMPFETKIITNQNPQRVQWSQLIQESMNQVTIDGQSVFEVELNQFEWNTYVSKILSGKSHTKNNIVAVGWSAGWDPDAYVHNLFHSETFTPKCCNINHYSNDRVDELIDKGLTTYGIEERRQIYTELQELIVKDSPMAFIRFGKAQDAFDKSAVHGFQTYPIDGAEFASLYEPASGKFTWVEKGQ